MMPNLFDMLLTTQRTYLQMWQRMLMAPGSATVPFAFSGNRQDLRSNHQDTQTEQVIPIGEEALDVSTRRVMGATTRVRRVVRTKPVERRVELRDEHVIVEHQPSNGQDGDIESIVEREYAMSDSHEVPVITKQTRLRGRVVLRKAVNNRMEVIRDVVHYADVEIDKPDRLPVVVAQEEGRRHEQHNGSDGRDSEHQGLKESMPIVAEDTRPGEGMHHRQEGDDQPGHQQKESQHHG
jgi:stress response protein YsnF